ncbi:MAG: class I SAM-dependent methyltransferase [bacterium]
MTKFIEIVRRNPLERVLFFKWLYRFWTGLPNMNDKEIELLKKILLVYKNKPITILEWGCGLSTIYFAKYLREAGCSFSWHAIENDTVWYKKILKKVRRHGLEDTVHVYLSAFTPHSPNTDGNQPLCMKREFASLEEAEKQYILLPKTLGISFDIIIVDGRDRNRCMEIASNILQPKGTIILHDSEKQYYHEALDIFPNGTFVHSGTVLRRGGRVLGVRQEGKIWFGWKQEDSDEVKQVRQIIAT